MGYINFSIVRVVFIVIKILIRQNLAPFIVSLWLMLGQQFSGMNAVMFYCVDIFKVSPQYGRNHPAVQAAGSSLDPNVANIIIGGVQVNVDVILYFSYFCL